jgi:diguanylate cyclase (GGDEF)-like protein
MRVSTVSGEARSPDPPMMVIEKSARRLSARRRLFLGGLGALAVTYALWLFLPAAGEHPVVNDLFFVPLGLAAAAAGVSASRRCAAWPRLRRAWLLLVVGALFAVAAYAAQAAYDGAGLRPYPSVADALGLFVYAFALAGILSFPALRRSRAERTRFVMDIAVAGFGGGAFIAYLVSGPALASDHSAPQVALSIAYPVGDMMLLAAAASLLLRGSAPSARPSLRLLAAGIGLYVVADMVYAYASLHPGYHSADPIALLRLAGLSLTAAAGTLQPVVDAPELLERGPGRGTWVPHAGAILALAGLMYSQRHDAPAELAVTVAVVALGGLVLLRQSLFQRDLLKARGQLDWQALHDPMTSLPDRHLLVDCAERALAESRQVRDGSGVALLLVDLDGFREVNDAVGHDAGDHVLVATARRLEAVLRAGETVARISGDTFALVVERVTDPLQLAAVAERVLSIFGEPFEVGHLRRRIGATVGIAVGDTDTEGTQLLRDAETAMHRAKDLNPGGYEVFTAELGRVLERRRTLSLELHTRLEAGPLELHYQPVVSLPEQRLLAVEALARWTHPTLGPVSPEEFIPIAEATGSITTLGRDLRERALEDLAGWRERYPDALPQGVLVNVSPRELREADFVSVLEAQLRRHGLTRFDIGLEVTEGLFIDDRDRTSAQALEELSKAGFRLLLDDLGTGYSALASLKKYPFSAVKIDRLFVGSILSLDAAAPVTRAAVGIARALDLEVIAEGVETSTQITYLSRIGCDAAQGFGIARPAPAETIRALLAGQAAREPQATEEPGIGYLEAPTPHDDVARIAALRRYAVLDTGRESELDEIAQLAAELCDAPMAFISLVDTEREYFKAAVGSDLQESPRDISFCGHGILGRVPLVIPDTREDARFATNPQVTRDGIRFYAGVPLRTPDGYAIGMLCVKDTRPRNLSGRQLNALTVLAHQVMAQLELRCARDVRRETSGALRLADDALAAVVALVPRRPRTEGA